MIKTFVFLFTCENMIETKEKETKKSGSKTAYDVPPEEVYVITMQSIYSKGLLKSKLCSLSDNYSIHVCFCLCRTNLTLTRIYVSYRFLSLVESGLG